MSSSLRSIHVVAAVITDARGRILLNRREGNRDLTGLWEFPGGKREPGESSEQALRRELHEELGIEAEIGAWLMEVPQLYPDKRLRLEVRQVSAWKGRPRGREGQAIMWVAPDKLQRYSMPPADIPVLAMLRQPERYLMPAAAAPRDVETWLDGIAQALSSGAGRIGLRPLPGEPGVQAVRVAVERHARQTQLLLHGDAGLARELGIGLHLQSGQLARCDTRPIADGLPLAASCQGLEDLKLAQALGCDFAVLGAADGSQASPLGQEAFEQLREQVSIPLYAVGEDLQQARRSGAHGIAGFYAC